MEESLYTAVYYQVVGENSQCRHSPHVDRVRTDVHASKKAHHRKKADWDDIMRTVVVDVRSLVIDRIIPIMIANHGSIA